MFLADGFEEIEGLTVVDVLRRAGADTETVSVMGRKEIRGSHEIQILADSLFEDVDFSDARLLVLPGGMPGTLNLKAHTGLTELLRRFDREEKYIGRNLCRSEHSQRSGHAEGKKGLRIPFF